jgi:hypothetical protein
VQEKLCKKNARKTQEKLHKSRRKDKHANGVKRARFDGQIA